MKLSKHFIENWKTRVGREPNAFFVRRIIRESVRAQHGHDVCDIKSGRMLFRVLAIYWHPGLDLIIKVDQTEGVAVTVLSGKNCKNGGSCMDKDIQFYINELKSEECFCERQKKPKRSFCFRCYKALPANIKKGLWSRIGDGYEDAYDEAMNFLSEEIL